MNIFKLIGPLLILLLMGSSSADTDYCAEKYKIMAHRTLVCYREPLNDVQINRLEKHLSKAIRLYPEFIKRYDISWKRPTDVLVIVIFTYREMNDPVLFAKIMPNYSNLPMGKVGARYFPNENILCITSAAAFISSPDLPHETVHWLNRTAGIFDKKKDESIAYAFESYYFSHK